MAHCGSGNRWRNRLSVVRCISFSSCFRCASFPPRGWNLRSLGTILDIAKSISQRFLCGFGDRPGQLDRKPRRVCGALRRGVDWAENWELARWRDPCGNCLVSLGKRGFAAPQEGAYHPATALLLRRPPRLRPARVHRWQTEMLRTFLLTWHVASA